MEISAHSLALKQEGVLQQRERERKNIASSRRLRGTLSNIHEVLVSFTCGEVNPILLAPCVGGSGGL